MTRQSLDPIRDRMIAALYGELSAEEERELQTQLAGDERLRAEWQELQEAHAFLATAETEEPTPSFVFAAPSEEGQAARQREAGRGSRASLWARLRAFGQTPVPALAVATVALVVLIVVGLRVDREAGGLVVRFGPRPATAPLSAEVAPSDRIPSLSGIQGAPIEPGPGMRTVDARAAGPQDFDEVGGIPVSSLGGYVTRAEFAAYVTQVNELLQNRLGDEEDRRRAELAYVVRGLYSRMEQEHRSDYDELNGRIQQVWLGLAGLGARETGRGFSLPNDMQPHGVAPVQQSTNGNR